MRFNSALIATTVLSALAVAAPSNTNKDSGAIVSKRESQDISRNPAGNLDMLYRDMRNFVIPSGFDYPKFQAQMFDTRYDLANIEFEVENMPVEGPLMQDVAYVSKVWDMMFFAQEKMSRYMEFSWPGDLHIYQVLDSHVNAMTLFNVHGELDTDISGVGAKVGKLEATVRKAMDDFNNVWDEVTPGVRTFFQAINSDALNFIELMGPVSN